MFRTPYRWTLRTAWSNVRYAAIDVIEGVRNVIRWTPVIWDDVDYDWADFAQIMEYKLRRMSRRNETARITADWRRQARQTLICAELLRRLLEDEYFKNAGYDPKTWKQTPDPVRPRHFRSSATGEATGTTSIGAQCQETLPIFVGSDVEEFARRRSIAGPLIVLKSWFGRPESLIGCLSVELVEDREVQAEPVICFSLRTTSGVDAALRLDEDFQNVLLDRISPEHQVYFALRFEFA